MGLYSMVKHGVGRLAEEPARGSTMMKIGERAVGVVAEGALGYGMGRAMGYAYHKYSWGKKVPWYAAGIGKTIAALVGGTVGGVADVAGQAGAVMIGAEHGLKQARAATGKRIVALPKGAALPQGAEEVDAIGAGARTPSYDDIERAASQYR